MRAAEQDEGDQRHGDLDANDVSGVDHHLDFANRLGKRVLAAVGLPRRKIIPPIGQDIAARWHGSGFDHMPRRVLFQAGDDPAALGIERCPPGAARGEGERRRSNR
ncbi:MAG: hypothetical protein ACREFK_10465 [Stellaceae bacterium]